LVEEKGDYMSANINTIFSQNFTNLLKNRFKTLADFSKETDTAYSTVSDWKNGKKLPRAGGLQMIANYFDTDIPYLITDHTTTKSEEPLTEIKNNNCLQFEGQRMTPDEIKYMTTQLQMFRLYKKNNDKDPENNDNPDK
jgi:phage-related cro/CI family transcription regulator